MQVHIHSKHLTIRDNLREYAEEKIGKLHQIYQEITSADIAFTRRSKNNGEDKYKVEVTLHCNGAIVRAEEDSTSPFAVVDFVTEKLERQLKRFKGKLYHNLSRDAKRLAANKHRIGDLEPEPMLGTSPNGHANGLLQGNHEEPVVVEDADEMEQAHDDGLPFIVRSKSFAVKPMTPSEAALQMELLGHDFHVFYNPDASMISVVYKRRDGNYGLIEPNVPVG